MSEFVRLLALVQQHGLEGWTLADTHRLKESAHQHAEALREYERIYGSHSWLRAAADFLDGGQ